MSEHDTALRARAERIADDEIACEANGWAYWTDTHSCRTGYGCCGGGKEIDRKALAAEIERELRAVQSEATAAERRRCAEIVNSFRERPTIPTLGAITEAIEGA